MRIDHLLLGTDDLETGRSWVAERLGLETSVGGRHAAWGTHNALASLGPDTYLEVIAPDPEGPGASILGLEELDAPRLVGFAVASDDLDGLVEAADDAGVDLGDVLDGHRETPTGDTLRWRITDPAADRLDGVVPFGIDWGDTPHPARALADQEARLLELVVEHPRPFEARRALAALGLDLLVRGGDAPRFEATIRTQAGEVTLT